MDATQQLPESRLFKALLLALFAAVLLTPFVGKVFDLNPQVEFDEKRTLAPFPEWRNDELSAQSWPASFECYYNDNFGLRNLFIVGYNYFKAKLVGVSPSEKVVMGKGEWLYLNVAADYARALKVFTPFELQLFALKLEAKQEWLAQRGVGYLFVVAPNKSTIYPEGLPDAYRQIGAKTRLQQLKEYLAAHSTVQILDLGEPLIAEKQHQQVYYYTNTHWNDHGCYLSYRAIMARLAQDHGVGPAKEPAEFYIYQNEVTGFDLSMMLGLKPYFLETSTFYEPNDRCSKPAPVIQAWARDWRAYSLQCHTRSGGLIVVGDSFSETTKLFDFLAEHFGYSLFLHREYFPMTAENLQILVDELHPDVLVEEVVERALGTEELEARLF